ncbi:MAG: DUF4269 domain-containing protein, partial [Chitinophagaceae bacterium]
MNFLKIDYLKDGNERQKSAYNTLVDYQIIEILADYNPILTGTIPINIDIDTSDLDIVCYWRDKSLTRREGRYSLPRLFLAIVSGSYGPTLFPALPAG